MTDVTNVLVFGAIVLLRIVVPMAIPRFPVPSIVAALLIDAADQTIFQTFTTLDLEGYQSYDKALDIYYLAIAYTATMRNWANLYGFRVSRFLWYYRLVGVTAFELLHWRPLLLIFPNTFEYFFIWYEGYRTRWNPLRLAAGTIIRAAAFIWIFIKLPQEYWIHIAQLDTTDLIKEDILGVSTDTSWSDAIGENLWVIPAVLAIAGILIFVGMRIWRRLRAADWNMTFDADDHADIDHEQAQALADRRFQWHIVLEKIVFIGLVSIIFSQILPGVGSSVVRLTVAVAVIVAANTFITSWLAERGRTWSSMLALFGVMAAINLGLSSIWIMFVSSDQDAETSTQVIVFFVLLLTLIVTFYDRYRPIYDQRIALQEHRDGTQSQQNG